MSPPTDEPDQLPGPPRGPRRFGPYRALRLVGTGSSAEVFEAEHERLGHRVIIKLQRRSAPPPQRARLRTEARLLLALRHPGLVRCLHVDSLGDGRLYLVLEHDAGRTLRERLGAGPLPVAEAQRLGAEIAAAMAAAHAQGVVHRDLKPDNVLLTPAGARVFDFGLGKGTQAPPAGADTLVTTAEDALLGTAAYMAPEQCLAGPVGPPADVYALGALLLEALTGQPPFVADSETSLLYRQVQDPPPALRQRLPAAPPALEALLRAMLAKRPEERPTMAAVAAALRARRPWPRRALAAGALLVAVLLVAARLPLRGPVHPGTAAPARTLVELRHEILTPFSLTDGDVQQALRQARIADPPRHAVVRVAPLQVPLADSGAIDFAAAARAQAQQVATALRPLLQAPGAQLLYAGLAPIPLAVQLGFLVGNLSPPLIIQHRRSGQWSWPGDGSVGQRVQVRGLPAQRDPRPGDVVLRLSVSAAVDPLDTAPLVPAPLCEVDIELPAPQRDALASPAALEEVARAFDGAMATLAQRLPGARRVHLFAAVPPGLAFRLGTLISPTMHAPVQTYQYRRATTPRYRAALLLGAANEAGETMAGASVPDAQRIDRRIATFVAWIRPEAQTEEKIRKQANEIRLKIREQAQLDQLIVKQTPLAGSFAKNTGLRRHVTGGSAVDGQDVDVPFVIHPQTRQDERISELLNRFQGYADRAYPQNPPKKSRSKSSIKLEFVGARLSYDLVPMLEDPSDATYQILLRGDGTQRRTSVERHTRFIRQRSDSSNQRPGPVRFNDMVRLFKWWREFQRDRSHNLKHVPSILIDLLCAAAYDAKSVAPDYAETLAWWFDYLYEVVKGRRKVAFKDYAPTALHEDAGAAWTVLDPVNPKNNVADGLDVQHILELERWLRDGRDHLRKAIDEDRAGHPQQSLAELVQVFGAPFKHHCGG